ncbi:MAG: amidohydrolase family protein [Armatimonadota bacterium]
MLKAEEVRLMGSGQVSRRLRYMDCNCRIGTFEEMEDCYFTEIDSLLAEMEYLGIGDALVLHTWASRWSPPKGNKQLDEILADYDNLYPCYVGLPPVTGELPDPEEFAAAVRQNHGAVRLFPSEHQYDFTPWCVGELLEPLADHGVPLMIEITQTNWDQVAAILDAFPDLPLVLLDTYYRINRHIYPLMDKHENLHLETHTYQVPFGIEDVTRRFGAQRLLFGTNLPENEGGGALAQLEYADLPEEHKQQIAGGNLRNLLGIAQ